MKSSLLLRLLLGCYFPFLLLLCLFMAYLEYLLVMAALQMVCVWTIVWPLVLLLGLTLLQILVSLPVLLIRLPDTGDFEVQLPRQFLEPIYRLLADLARSQDLRLPHDIRIGADTVAHVYEDGAGQRILVVGGMALAAFSQQALAGVLAHELAHFTSGDTRLTRRAQRGWWMMAVLEQHFQERPSTRFNPLFWLIYLYHYLFRLAWAANSRQQELAADQHLVRHVGPELAASALLHVTVSDRLPWVKLSNIIKTHVANNQPLDAVFAEQVKRARATDAAEWQEACASELKKKTKAMDSHPCLRERLKAMGISPKRAIKLMLDQSGPAAKDLFPAWEAIEKVLTEEIVAAYREVYLIKQDMAQIMRRL